MKGEKKRLLQTELGNFAVEKLGRAPSQIPPLMGSQWTLLSASHQEYLISCVVLPTVQNLDLTGREDQ
jgi:hypothetical protein